MHANTPLTPIDIELCVDCVYVIANGVDDNAEDVDQLTVTAQRLAEAWPGESPATTPAVTLGTIDGDDDEPWFSWHRCDGCGSTLGGDRHPATGWLVDEERTA